MGNRIWTLISFFAIVGQLTVIRGFDGGQVLLFILPVLFALMISTATPTTRGALLAKIFLSLIGFGLLIAELPWLFPALGGVDRKLARESDRVLTWYCAVYLLYVTVILPCHMFTTALRQHSLGNQAQFSRFTCCLGLFTSFILGLGMIWVVVTFLHVLPVL